MHSMTLHERFINVVITAEISRNLQWTQSRFFERSEAAAIGTTKHMHCCLNTLGKSGLKQLRGVVFVSSQTEQ